MCLGTCYMNDLLDVPDGGVGKGCVSKWERYLNCLLQVRPFVAIKLRALPDYIYDLVYETI